MQKSVSRCALLLSLGGSQWLQEERQVKDRGVEVHSGCSEREIKNISRNPKATCDSSALAHRVTPGRTQQVCEVLQALLTHRAASLLQQGCPQQQKVLFPEELLEGTELLAFFFHLQVRTLSPLEHPHFGSLVLVLLFVLLLGFLFQHFLPELHSAPQELLHKDIQNCTVSLHAKFHPHFSSLSSPGAPSIRRTWT